MSDRVFAPFGRRAAHVTARARYGRYAVLRAVDRAGPMPQAGQFYMLSAARGWGGGAGERPFLPRAFSVLRAATVAEDELELWFLLDDVGPGTRRLWELLPGDELGLVGPLGRGFRAPRAGRTPLLVGGGVGIAPLVAWQDRLGGDVPALVGFRDGGYAPAAELLERPQVATEDGSVGRHGRVTELLAAELTPGGAFEVFACGPPAMLATVRLLCAERATPAQLALESGMACGFGACFGCVVATRTGYLRLCLDGPVLDAEQLEPASLPGATH